jgi:hypothetical protein
MSRKTSVNLNDKRLDKRFATWLAITIALIAPKFLWIVAGRGTSKTSDIQAERFIEVCYDMPGAYFAWVADTYVNALKNIIPALIEGLNRKGWIEGIHYVIDQPPPAHFAKPYKAPQSYKHTISIFNGCFVNIVSMDQPSGAAGNSYQHLFGDEAKYLDFNKIKKLTPALRGYKKFAASVYYRGSTFTTDMPNVADGEFDWILDREKEMNEDQCRLALQTALVINEIQIEKMNEEKAGNAQKVIQLQKQLLRWEKRWRKVRKESTFFKVVSSYVNVDFLSPEWFKDSLMHLGAEEFKTAVGSFPAKAKKGERFYINMSDQHFYDDGIMTEFYEEKYKIGDENIVESSLAQRYLQKNKPIDIGVDFGNMCSMVSGQQAGEFVFLFKEFYTLPPHHLRELANQFLEFYKDHPEKKINLYYDRSGNAYEAVGKDFATELSNYLKFNVDGTPTGWQVDMMNKGQSTIFHYQEYQLMKNIMSEENPDLPKLRICKFGCPNLRSAMGKTKTIVVKDKRSGRPFIGKNKTSEKLHPSRLPRESTNIPDAMKYFFFRISWVEASGRKKRDYVDMSPEVIGR